MTNVAFISEQVPATPTAEDVQKALTTLSKFCVKALFAMTALSVITIVALSMIAILCFELGKAARRWWTAHHITQLICEQVILNGLYALAWLTSNAPMFKAAIAQAFTQAQTAYVPTVATLKKTPATADTLLTIVFQLA